jgi:hypothetical protein
MKRKHLAWHFVGDKLRDGSPVPKDGEWLKYKGPLKMCESGLHWSRQPFDALKYAPGETLCLVEVGGDVMEPKSGEHTDKGISTKRKIIARMDATGLLRYFARMQALSVIHLNEDLPEVVCDYLMTGDESLRAVARDAARAVARDAARAAAGAAARAAAGAAAWDAAGAAAWDAAGAAAWDAAGDAARAAAGAAAGAAAREHFNSLVYECFEEYL